MAIITLTTDFGIKDHFVGAVKGAIYSELPDARIVDISHLISPFNITETAYILKNSYKSFPEGSIHIIGVDAELTEENNHLAIKLDNHFFICPNNGVISLLTTDIKPEKIVEINIHNRIESSFPVLDVFVKVACHIARGGSLDVIGKPLTSLKNLTEVQPTIPSDGNSIFGSIIYVDNYGNSISNIHKKLFTEIGKGRSFEIIAKSHKFSKINTKYSDIIDFSLPKDQRQKDGTKLAIFNSANFLEISIYKSNLETVGGASSLLGLNYRDNIIVKFI
ncbi:S-adenosyl-l-methionine hydroxide adenosyltransferase family protein [Lutibacter sp.]|uniref:SAM hydrolase/SAM-dependent halogenase family protein n=1 Tax=Lutibacter sp. TaxID=1925666 RepID=UPI002733B480|nr:SAM-dependent chlorinase/fluorinase [Lutibacter sp.]MDP3314056.1 SAM-dependent chlorinase/fluorinase [Lutibacter sp.]